MVLRFGFQIWGSFWLLYILYFYSEGTSLSLWMVWYFFWRSSGQSEHFCEVFKTSPTRIFLYPRSEVFYLVLVWVLSERLVLIRHYLFNVVVYSACINILCMGYVFREINLKYTLTGGLLVVYTNSYPKWSVQNQFKNRLMFTTNYWK